MRTSRTTQTHRPHTLVIRQMIDGLLASEGWSTVDYPGGTGGVAASVTCRHLLVGSIKGTACVAPSGGAGGGGHGTCGPLQIPHFFPCPVPNRLSQSVRDGMYTR